VIELLGEKLEILADVARRWPIANVVIQDEFTHDVVAQLPDGTFAVFDAT
jgi:hypothetical protein